jgi:hypothetical protein
MIMSNNLETMWNEMVTTYFQAHIMSAVSCSNLMKIIKKYVKIAGQLKPGALTQPGITIILAY